MNPDMRSTIAAIIVDVAPDADIDSLEGNEDLRDALDIDSMDFINILSDIKKSLNVEVPESDYSQVTTLDDLVTYITARTAANTP